MHLPLEPMKKQVWVIEDDPDIGEIVSFLLNEDGHQVTLFNNATSFESAVADGQKPDLFLMDVMLPDGNGIDLCEVVKNHQDLQSLPVMMMSAHAAFAKVQQFCKADDFIAKPFDIDMLSAKVNKLLY